MRIGISCYDLPARDVVQLAATAERVGFDSIWLGEHIVAPVEYASTHPAQPGADGTHGSADHNGKPIVDLSVELVDPLVTLAAVAARTTRLGVATGIYLLPLRHPLLAARAAATLSSLSGGRLRLGVGAGWLREEFAALDAPFSGRTSRMEESLAILRTAWRGGPFEFHGTHYDFPSVQVSPHVVSVPLVLGGNSEPALRRAVALGDGWFSSGIPTFDEARRLRDRLARLGTEAGRAAPLSTTWRIPSPDPALMDAYTAEGFDEVLIMAYDVWTGPTLEGRVESLEKAAAHLGLTGVGR